MQADERLAQLRCRPTSGYVLPMTDRKREFIDTGPDKRYARRDDQGRFTRDQVDVGRSSAADQRQHTTTAAKRGQGDRGDRQPKR
jgi:hypothetical protein